MVAMDRLTVHDHEQGSGYSPRTGPSCDFGWLDSANETFPSLSSRFRFFEVDAGVIAVWLTSR